MTHYARNNDYDLESISVSFPFEVGDVKRTRECWREWLVRWRDEHPKTQRLCEQAQCGGAP
jgi:hypothetical protein